MLADIDKETVDFGPNYDESLVEPLVLPSKVPNLLVNGAGGIAVGYATNIPTHNLGEVIEGLLLFLDESRGHDCPADEEDSRPRFSDGRIHLWNGRHQRRLRERDGVS